MLVISVTVYAQSYRGMFDLSVGKAISAYSRIPHSEVNFQIDPLMAGTFTTSHGCQINKFLFAGIGAGICLDWVNAKFQDNSFLYSHLEGKYMMMSIPIFLDLRWDLDISRKITPFVDIKIGYQIGSTSKSLNENDYYYRAVSNYSFIRASNSIYFQPSIGVRFKGGKRSGFNLGISYIPVLKNQLSMISDNNLGFNTGAIMLNLGFDI